MSNGMPSCYGGERRYRDAKEAMANFASGWDAIPRDSVTGRMVWDSPKPQENRLPASCDTCSYRDTTCETWSVHGGPECIARHG